MTDRDEPSEPSHAEEQLRRSEERFRLLVENVKDYAIFMLDPAGNVVTWNVGANRIKGYSASEIIGRHFSTFYPEADVRGGKCEFELEVAGEQGRFEDEGWRVRKDGTLFWANVVITALRDASGELIGFAKVTRDLTERRRAEDERVQLAQAQEANRVKDEFLATISHELRTPLNAILGWSTILQQHASDPRTSKAAETIRRNAEAQARLIEDILDVSRVVTGSFRLEVRVVDVAAIVREAMEVVRPAANAKGIELVHNVDGPVPLVGDPTRLQQVAWNLLSNAVKFTDEGGEVHVDLIRRNARIRLVVRDTGRGIAPEFLPHVFERFRQADPSTTRRFGGLGLGLSIVRHIVELHGGEVFAASEGPGRGATFEVSLPVRALSPRSTTGRTNLPPVGQPKYSTARLDGLRVLLVDDEPDALELLTVLLTAQGATVHTAASAAEARRAIEELQAHVLVSDIGMPDEDGYDLMRAVRALPATRGGNVPAIALTAYARAEDRLRAFDAGYNGHLAKPVDPDELLTVVRNLGALAVPLKT